MQHETALHLSDLAWNSVPVAMVIMDTDSKITSFNTAAEDLTGYSIAQAVGKSCAEILGNTRCTSECPVQIVKEYGESITGLEAELVNRYDEHIPVRISAAAIENDNGDCIGYLEVIEDISREKALEREKNNFLFMLAHDMKSPLVAIQGLINNIRQHHDDMAAEKLEKYCKTIKDSGEQLEAQVIEFLEYSRQLTDKIKLNPQNLDVTDLIEQIIERHRPEALKKNITIHTEIDDISLIEADANQLKRVFENLLNNAIKFINPNGEIAFSAQETNREIIIQIKDSGPGINAEDLPYIFDAFHQSKASSKGHGLGLAAVKAIVQEHGGRVAVKSSPKEGSIFTVRIPKKM